MTVINIADFNFCGLKEAAINNLCDLSENALLKNYTSFKTGGECPLLITPKSKDALSAVLKAAKSLSVPFVVLGNGSNVLAPDEGVKKAVIKIADGLTEIKLLDDNRVFCEAGVRLSSLCKFALENSLSGLEFAYGIPGTVGGAVFMNAGAYGGEMKDVVKEARHLDLDGNEGSFSGEELKFSYRSSVYESGKYIITGAVFELKKAPKEEIKAKMDDLASRRVEKQPLEYPSAGSTFKRPEGYFAGALIEQCGLKGKSVGGAEVSEKHAGFIINKNNATSNDIKALIELVKETVFKETGVLLEAEVRNLE